MTVRPKFGTAGIFDGQAVSYDNLLDYAVEYDGVRFVNLEFLSRMEKMAQSRKRCSRCEIN